jgi:hypothetical protein
MKSRHLPVNNPLADQPRRPTIIPSPPNNRIFGGWGVRIQAGPN